MATGAGKTFHRCHPRLPPAEVRRLPSHPVPVDRNNLGEQTIGEFQNYPPRRRRRFTEIYNVDNKLTSAGMVGSSRTSSSPRSSGCTPCCAAPNDVPEGDGPNLDDYVPDAPVTVPTPDLPQRPFDLIIVDEAHRSIYGVWREVPSTSTPTSSA